MKKFLPILIILFLGVVFLLIIQFGSQSDPRPHPKPPTANMGGEIEANISSLKQQVYNEEDYSRLMATLGAALSNNEVTDGEYSHLFSLVNMAKCNSLTLLFDSTRNAACGDWLKIGGIVVLMNKQREIITIPDMEKRIDLYKQGLNYYKVLKNVEAELGKEYDAAAVSRLKKDLDQSAQTKYVSECESLLNEKNIQKKYLDDFYNAVNTFKYHFRKPFGSIEQADVNFIKRYSFYYNKLKNHSPNLN